MSSIFPPGRKILYFLAFKEKGVIAFLKLLKDKNYSNKIISKILTY